MELSDSRLRTLITVRREIDTEMVGTKVVNLITRFVLLVESRKSILGEAIYALLNSSGHRVIMDVLCRYLFLRKAPR